MGIISDSVLQHGGSVIAVVPDAMLRAGGEGEQHSTWGPIGHDELEEKGREKVESVSHIPCLFCSQLKYTDDFLDWLDLGCRRFHA
jgi:hypothetical protein